MSCDMCSQEASFDCCFTVDNQTLQDIYLCVDCAVSVSEVVDVHDVDCSFEKKDVASYRQIPDNVHTYDPVMDW